MGKNRMPRVYISGQMSGRPEEEYKAHFRDAEAKLFEEGYNVFNPCRWGWFLKHLPYRFCLVFDLFMMCFCDRIYLLDGWTLSDGANAEHRFAVSTGMIVTYES